MNIKHNFNVVYLQIIQPRLVHKAATPPPPTHTHTHNTIMTIYVRYISSVVRQLSNSFCLILLFAPFRQASFCSSTNRFITHPHRRQYVFTCFIYSYLHVHRSRCVLTVNCYTLPCIFQCLSNQPKDPICAICIPLFLPLIPVCRSLPTSCVILNM
jgi:hypothetical protein